MVEKLLIGYSTAEMSRHAVFYDHFNLIEKPPNTFIFGVHGQSPARARNEIVKQALENKCSHILFLDDDVLVPKDIIYQLARHDKDIVSGYYLMRQFPHQGIIFREELADGHCVWYDTKNDETGLIEIVNCGLGAVLIKTKVFENLEQPYVRLGQIEKDHWCDDIDFFNRVRALGYRLYCDLSVTCGHLATLVVQPRHDGNGWVVDYNTYGTSKISFPAITGNSKVEKNENS